MAAYYGLPSQASYSSSKAAVLAYSEAIRSELTVEGIGVTTIHPGAIKTEMMTATLQESDNMDQALKNYALAKRWGVEAEVAADKILRAAGKKRNLLRIGLDAHILYYVTRIMPNVLGIMLAKTFKKSVKKGDGAA
jgi:short-subunit dehydrogenase